MKTLKHFCVCASIVLLCVAIGCAKQSNRKPVYAVAGKALFKGEPLVGARIGFHPLGHSGRREMSATAQVDDDGAFALTTYEKGDGAPAGEYVVTIYWPDERSIKENNATPEEGDGLPPDRLKREYAVAKTTKLRATVHNKPNTIDFNLP